MKVSVYANTADAYAAEAISMQVELGLGRYGRVAREVVVRVLDELHTNGPGRLCVVRVRVQGGRDLLVRERRATALGAAVRAVARARRLVAEHARGLRSEVMLPSR